MSLSNQEQYVASLEAALAMLYGATSRAESADISREILRINQAIQTLADKHLSPLDPITDFKSTMLSFQDASSQDRKQK